MTEMEDFGARAPDEIVAGLSLSDDESDLDDGPPPPGLHNQGVIAVDITDKILAACNTLSPGELVKDGFFTLFESVSALEIGDPKMDSGCVKPGDEFEELYDVSRPLLPEEVLGIIDQLLCHEMSWHLGYPLLQTLFTSVYLEALLAPNPLSVQTATFVQGEPFDPQQSPMLSVLRAYCLGMLRSCGYVNEQIGDEDYYEEEDFVTSTFNRILLDTLPADAIQQTIADAQELLQSLRGSMQDQMIDALASRLELRHAFLDAVQCPQHAQQPELARAPWKRALSILPRIKSTHALAKPVDEAFSAKLQRKLASTMPPREIVKISFDDAFGHISRLYQDSLDSIDVLDYTDSQCLQTFVSTFQAKKPQPMVYVRMLIQIFLYHGRRILGGMSIRQLLDDDLSIVSLPASPLLDRGNDEVEVRHDPRFAISKQMEQFRQRAAQPFLSLMRTFCQNRCRVRRNFCHVVKEWEALQFAAEDLDLLLQAKLNEQPGAQQSVSSDPADSYALPLSSWAYWHKLRQMEWIVQCGFELEVYQPDELAGMYWYLNYLSKCRAQHSERIKSFVVKRFDESRESPSTPAAEKQMERSLAFVRLSMLDAAVTWELSDALSCLYAVLARLKLIKAPSRLHTDDRLRYELRMRPFTPVGLPDLPSFEDFTAGTVQADTPTKDILDYAEKALGGAKRGFEMLSKLSPEDSFSVGSHDRWLASVKNGLKSCIAAGIAISTVQKAVNAHGDDGGDLNITAEVSTPDSGYHEWWIVPKILPVS